MKNIIKRFVCASMVIILFVCCSLFICSKKVSCSAVPSIEYVNGAYWNRGTYGVIRTDSGVESYNAYAHPERSDGTQVICMVRTMGTANTKDDKIEYYRFWNDNYNYPTNNY